MSPIQQAALTLDSAIDYLKHRDPYTTNIYPKALVIGTQADWDARCLLGECLRSMAADYAKLRNAEKRN